MGNKLVKSVRLDPLLEGRVKTYAESLGVKESEAIRDLITKGLACEALTVFCTPLGSVIRGCVEAEISLLRAELQERNEELEDRLARVCSRGTKASIQASVQLNELSRAIIPAWQEVSAEELYAHYSRVAGEMQAGRPYGEARGWS